jgi:hypothetical protein
MACLLEVLRGQTGQRAVPEAEWLQAFALAGQELVLPSFVAALRRWQVEGRGEALSEPVDQALIRAEQEIRVNNFWWTSELRGILAAFVAAGIPVIPLKGPMLADRIYGGSHLRMSRDLDLLVQPASRPAARRLLGELGFSSPAVPDDYHQRWNRGTTRVELHHDVENPLAFAFDTRGAWQRARPREFLGQPVLELAPADELLFVCLHGVRHRFEQISQILDVVRALRTLAPDVPAGTYLASPYNRLRPVLLIARAMAERLDPACLTEPAIRAMDPGPSGEREQFHFNRIADALWAFTLERAGVKLDWGEQHSFYLDLEISAPGRLARRARHALILSSRLIQSDYDFAAKFGVRSEALVWSLRQLRLLGRLRRS